MLAQALTFHRAGQFEPAVGVYRQILAAAPLFAQAHNNLGHALQGLGRLEEAVESYRQASRLKPNDCMAQRNLSVALQALGRRVEAIEAYRRAIVLEPRTAGLHQNLGAALLGAGQFEDAVAALTTASALQPDLAEAHYNLGLALHNLGRYEESIAATRKALERNPGWAEGHANIAAALQLLGRLDEARIAFLRAQELAPGSPRYTYASALALPVIPMSVAEIDTARAGYAAGIARLMDIGAPLHDVAGTLLTNAFYLAYHNRDDREIMTALTRMLRAKSPELSCVAPRIGMRASLRKRTGGRQDRRLRVGFLSAFLVSHTIGKLNRGFIKHLDRALFEVIVIHAASARHDDFASEIDKTADRVVRLSPELGAQHQVLAGMELDILMFPDIGMNPETYSLAFGRYAPVQAMSWGHPDTTGLETIDYMVSATTIEPPGAEAHYSERLIKLNRLPCFYEPLLTPTLPSEIGSSRATLGLPETGTLYGCPQRLFKFHPDFDPILAAIAAGDPEGHIILLEDPMAAWSGLLRKRWATTAPLLLERVRFLPQMPLDRFMELVACCDVLLDPPHFGGGNSHYEAMVHGTPTVTWPGRFMRARIASGAYKQMGITATIAPRLADYAPLAVSLGQDPARRAAIRTASQAAAPRLFADMGAVRELERFFLAASKAADAGERLPSGWQPPRF